MKSYCEYIEINNDLFHLSPVIIPETQSRSYMGRGMIAGVIWKRSCINLIMIYFGQIVLWSK